MSASGAVKPTPLFGCSPAAIGIALAILLLAIIQQSVGHQNCDNSWLFTVAERVLDGRAPYVDFIESNPPASFLIYMPAVVLARLVGTTVEFMVCACVFVGGLGVILFTGRILLRTDQMKAADAGVSLNMAVFIMLFVPGILFAQREHVAMLCLLPLLGVYGARAQGARCGAWDAVAAGLMAGIAISIKPHFCLAALFPLGFAIMRQRSPRLLFQPENWAILSVALAYAALLNWRYFGYFAILPMLLDAYLPLKFPLYDLVVHPTFLTSVLLVCCVVLAMRKRRWPVTAAMSLWASVGFMGSYLVQGKGFPNHTLPCICFALLASALVIAPAVAALLRDGDEAPEWRAWRWLILFGVVPVMAVACYFCGVVFQFNQWEEHDGLRAAVLRLAPPQPRLIAVSTQFHVGHPLVRQVGGIWAGRPNGLWVTGTTQSMLIGFVGDDAYRARLVSYIDRDARMFLEDVRSQKPDLILADQHRSTIRAMEHPDIVAALADYAPLEKVDDVTLWARKTKP